MKAPANSAKSTRRALAKPSPQELARLRSESRRQVAVQSACALFTLLEHAPSSLFEREAQDISVLIHSVRHELAQAQDAMEEHTV